MKKLSFILLIAAVTVFSTSCKSWFEGVNDSPNDPLDVPESVLLPSIQGALAYGVGGDASRYTSVMMQHVSGVNRQMAVINSYQISPNDVNNFWRFNLYSGPLNDAYLLNEKASTTSPHYAGVAKFLLAYGLSIATDLWGDIPYTEAFQGSENLNPAYDSQQSVYTAMQSLLDEAITEMGSTDSPLTLGSEDLIYGGDMQMWIQAANVLKARLYLHLGAVAASNYTSALGVIDGADVFTSSADDFTFAFGSGATEQNPWYQFMDQRQGDISTQAYIQDVMTSINDPRFYVYFDTATGGMGDAVGGAAAPFNLMSYTELKFIEAEAAFPTDKGRAATAHNDAIKASLASYSIVDPAYEAAEASETAGSITMDKIMTHKWIAMYLNPEMFNDYRRTGIPVLTPPANNVTNGVVPTRFPYPQSEELYNKNMPTGTSITTKVWWDM